MLEEALPKSDLLKSETEKGFSKIRTVRLLGIVALALAILFGVLFLALSYVDDFASQVVNLAMARYSNFTGKFALNNFEEDKRLMAILLSVKDELLPLVECLKPIAFVSASLFGVAALVFWIFPSWIAERLLRFRILRVAGEGSGNSISPFSLSKKTLVALATLVTVVLLSFFVLQRDPAKENLEKAAELERETARFVQLQRQFYQKNKKLGTWAQIGYEPAKSDDFLFEKRGKFAWQAKNRKSWEECPDSSVWKASFEMTGFFTKELKIYISAPKAANCAHLTPDFRQNVLQRSKEKY
ncbi:hypothetical protein [uncultured Fibrobacter sp.]|uniref:hypothetical protein n=1 Tax=uncultured Fibrobacter sp. TaxID=261512 RepID=UPI0028045423|nr:hypothetical protein [uncultured Fibrobacter sp.]